MKIPFVPPQNRGINGEEDQSVAVASTCYLPAPLNAWNLLGRHLMTLRRASSLTDSSLDVDLLEFALGPPHRFLGRHALKRLGVHVGDDVFRYDLGGVAARRAGPTGRARRHDDV